MSTYILLAILLLILLGLAFYFYLRDVRYSRKSTVETMGNSLWDEIEKEHEDAYERRRLFKKAIEEKKRDGKP